MHQGSEKEKEEAVMQGVVADATPTDRFRAVARPPEWPHSLEHQPALSSAYLQPAQWVRPSSDPPRLPVPHHVTRRSPPPCFQ